MRRNMLEVVMQTDLATACMKAQAYDMLVKILIDSPEDAEPEPAPQTEPKAAPEPVPEPTPQTEPKAAPEPVPADDPATTTRRRGRPRKVIAEEAPSLLARPEPPAEPVEASEPTATPEPPVTGDGDVPWGDGDVPW